MGPRWLQIVEQLAPIIIAATVPGAGPVLATVITQGIHSAEAMHDASGDDKLKHAVEIANETAAGINAVKPNTIDPSLVNAAANSTISTIVQVANLVHNTPVTSSDLSNATR